MHLLQSYVCVHSIQLEGENYLHFAQMEVYGTYGDYYKVGRVSHVAATHGATVVSMGPVVDEAYDTVEFVVLHGKGRC